MTIDATMNHNVLATLPCEMWVSSVVCIFSAVGGRRSCVQAWSSSADVALVVFLLGGSKSCADVARMFYSLLNHARMFTLYS